MTEQKETKKQEKKADKIICNDKICPFHGEISLRGRTFKGVVIKKFPKRLTIEFNRVVYVKKYERYAKKKTKIHARLPDCLAEEIKIGDYVEVQECRKISKIINFVVIKKIK